MDEGAPHQYHSPYGFRLRNVHLADTETSGRMFLIAGKACITVLTYWCTVVNVSIYIQGDYAFDAFLQAVARLRNKDVRGMNYE